MSDEFDDLPGLDDIDDGELPGLDDIDDADDLPGLDDKDSGPDGDGPTAGAESAANAETPPEWSEKELDEWWERFCGDGGFSGGAGVPFDDTDFMEAYQALNGLTVGEDFWDTLIPGGGWQRLSHEMKVQFRRGWERPDLGSESEPEDSVVGDLAPITLLGGDWSEPGVSPDESVLDEMAPYGQPAAGPDAPVPDAEKTSPAPGRFNWIWLIVPVVGAALGLGLFVLMGGSEDSPSTPSASVDVATDKPGTEVVVDEPSEDVEVVTTTIAVTTTAAPAGLFPPEDYGPCHIHPEEDATNCRPHYDLGVSETSMNNFGDFIYLWETTQTFMGPVPVDPEFPIEYKLVIESTNGQQIEHLLSGGPGEPLTCVRRVNGVETPLVEGEICGEFTAPDSLDMLIDVSAFAPGIVSWVFSTLETEPDGTRHGDWVAGGGNENFELGG